jgi:Phosphotransferase enzyme family
VLVSNGSVSGIIDRTDACLCDPAIDLAWVLHGTPAPFREAALRTYNPSSDERRRSLDWHRLGPWHEVLFGIDEGGSEYVESGLDGVNQRLLAPRHCTRSISTNSN